MLRQKIVNDQIQALKEKKQEKLDLLRYILAQIKNKEIDKKAELSDEETLTALRKVAKELNESIEAFKKGSREDLVTASQKQLTIVKTYLPPEITDEELRKLIKEIIDKNQELYQKNAKAIIGVCMRELKNKADPSRIMRALSTSTS